MNYFRIILTILASFCAFLAYLSRLNLSLSINRMAGPCSVFPAQPGSNTPDENIVSKLISFMPAMQTIEHSQLCSSNPIESRCNRLPRGLILAPLSQVYNAFGPNSTLNQAIPDGQSNSVSDQLLAGPEQIPSSPQLLDWTEAQKSNLLGAFFYGYVLTQIPFARLAEKFGAKPMFLMVGFGASFCSFLFPLASKLPSGGYLAAYAIRVILGATQGALFPAVYVLFCDWLPKKERPKWLPFPSAFSRFGTIAMNLLVPIVLRQLGWEAVFYFSGGLALIWCIIFAIFASSKPKDNIWISRQELFFIESHMEPQIGSLASKSKITASGFTINESAATAEKAPDINWLKIIKNKAIFMMALVMFTAEWSNFILLIYLPKFLEPVFNMSCEEIGQWSSIMVGLFCIGYPLFGYLATKLDNSSVEWFTPIRVRKLFELLANVVQAAGCLIIAFNNNKYIVIGALYLMIIGRSMVGGGQCLMPPELSRDFSGTIFAYSNTIANTAGVLGPFVVSWVVGDLAVNNKHSDWFWFFVLSAGIFLVVCVIFLIFADNEPQNLTKKPKLSPNTAVSQAQLYTIDIDEAYKMSTFSRISSEPNHKVPNYPNYKS